MNLGETICRLRTHAGLSQSDLAEALEVSRQSVSKWETNASVPDLDKLVRMADFFHVSLDQLVKGEEQQPEPLADSPVQQPAPPPANQQTRARSVGVVLLCCTAVIGVIAVVFFGLAGLIFTIPTLVPGLICRFAKKHPGLKAAWTDFLILDAYLSFATGIRASTVLLTFQWTYEMNYMRLAIGWVLFLANAAVMIGTAAALRKDGWTGSVRQKLLLILAAAVLVLTSMPFSIPHEWYFTHAGLLSGFFLLHGWAKLWSLTMLLTSLLRYLWTRKHR